MATQDTFDSPTRTPLDFTAMEEALHRTKTFADALIHINDVLHSSLDADTVMQHMVSEGARLLEAESAALSLLHADGWEVRNAHGLPKPLVGTVMRDEENLHARLAVESGQPVVVPDAFHDERFNREHLRRYTIRSVLVVPLIAQGEKLGVLFFNYHATTHAFTDEEVSFARQLASAAASALMNARLYTERAQVCEALRVSVQQLSQAMVAGQVFSFDWNPVTDEVLRSENCASILGIDPQSCTHDTGEAYFRRIHSEDRETFKQLVQRLKPSMPEYEMQYRYLRDDGRTIWLEESGCAEFDSQGRVVRLKGITADATVRIESQQKAMKEAAGTAAVQSAVDIVNAMRECVVLMLLDGTVESINPAVTTLTGLSQEDLVGKNLRSILPSILIGKDLDMALRGLDDVAQARIPELDVMVVRAADSPPVTVIPSMTIIPTPQGKPPMVLLTLKDVTELHRTGALLSEIFDSTHMQIAYLDTDFNFVRVNRAYAEACRCDPQCFVGKNHFNLYPHPENEAIFRKVREMGEPFSITEKPFEFPGQPERGVTYWDWSLHPLMDAGGEIQGILFCLLDATERVRARQRLVDSERQYRELVENANSIIMRITPDHRITFFNEYAQTFFGYSTEEILGQSVLATIVPEIDSEGKDLRKLTEEISAHPELHMSSSNDNICKDGRRVHVHWTNRAIRDEQGEVKEILCVGTDITQRHRLERETNIYRQRLRQLADRLARAEEQERRRISSHIHDTIIQTLSLGNVRLGGVRAAVDTAGLVEEHKSIEQVRKLLDTGITECRALMGDLTPPLLYEVGLGSALRSFADKQRELHGQDISVEVSDQISALDDARRGLLFQSARELVMNALKHAGPCRIGICVSLDGTDAVVEVQDTGKGFDTADDGLFEVDDDGGFGLFNIRERVHGLGGRLDIESIPGKGTIVRVTVPVAPQLVNVHERLQ